jgi:hypothetical protein
MIELDVSHFAVYKKEPKRDLLNAVFVAWLVSDFRQAQVRVPSLCVSKTR